MLKFLMLRDENVDEDPELKVIVKDDGPIERRLKDAFLVTGKEVMLQKIWIYVDRMAEGGPMKEDLKVKKPKSQTMNAGPAAALARKVVRKEVKKKEEGKKGFKTITMSERFHCRARDVYEILMDENRLKKEEQGFALEDGTNSQGQFREFILF